MLNISSALQSLYANGGIFQFKSKLQILDRNYNLIIEVTDDIIDGQISCDKDNASYRQLNIRLSNVGGKYIWGAGNLIWLDKYFKLYFGVLVNGSWEWLPQGVFPCSKPIATSTPGVNEVKFTCQDKMSLLDKCTTNITVQGGVADPVSSLNLSTSGSGSSLSATTYYVAFDYTNSSGRTTKGSSQASITVTAGQNITTSITLPSNSTGCGIYVGTTSSPLLLGTISSSGTISYSGTSTSGLSVSVSGQTLNITISASASATGASPQTTNNAIGADIATSIKSLLNGIETMFNLDDTSSQQHVPYDFTWQTNTDYSKIIKDLADILTWEIYYDVNGYLRLRAPLDPTTTPPMLTMSTSPTGFNLWAGADRELDDSNLANYIVVNGGSSQTGFVQYIMQDNNASSPTSIQNIGKRVYLHNNGNSDPVITTTTLAQNRATYEYKKRLQILEKLNFNMFPCPFMEHDDVYQITDTANGTSGKYQVVNFTLPIGSNSFHTGYLWQVRTFS